MFLLASFLIAFGILGLVGSTFGSVWLALTASRISGSRKKVTSSSNLFVPIRIDILVAAHNEEEQVVSTLKSLAAAREKLVALSGSDVRIRVGADHCTDGTIEKVREWSSEVEIVTNPGRAGKWNMLQALVSGSDAEWVALVDVGSCWDPLLLVKAYADLLDPGVMGIAPSYRAVKAGRLERLSWSLERALKKIESKAGGPVTVHGATVLYRRTHLLKAFQELATLARPSREHARSWLNDDVVIPLMMRIQSPSLRISYLWKEGGDAWVRDYGLRTEPNVEYGRRKRILRGNLEWMRCLYGRALSKDLVVGLLASRRVFRAFWSYWLFALVLGGTLVALKGTGMEFLAMVGALFALILCLKMPLRGGLERLRAAFRAGLELPLHWFNSDKTMESVWN